MFDKLGALVKRSEEIDEMLARPEVVSDPERVAKLAKERADLQPVVSTYQRLMSTRSQLDETKGMVRDEDKDVAALAQEEVSDLTAKMEALEAELRNALLPKDPNDDKNVIMEVRAGTGGDEAALFAGDLYRMYLRYSQRRGLKVDVINTSETGQGGIKEVVFGVSGKGAYRLLKHESGVHRVQRVPVTEAQGRIHTSTATVAVLPEAEEVDVEIKDSDLRIDIYHSGGPGGQNVNKVATAVRIVHQPSGIMVAVQEERSQLKNKIKAMTVLRSRLYEREMREQQAQTSAARRSQVGTGERSEKVRTYNFPQDRLTDHRINMSVHGLEEILAGQGRLDDIVDGLLLDEQARLLQEAVA
ncbi:MAG: peptide chain release factor 1 [Dehalococcoidia bacterium]